MRGQDGVLLLDGTKYYPGTPDNLADWQLIAAAPDMLAALKLALAWIEDHDCDAAQDSIPNAVKLGRAVIVKAEGRG